MRLGFSVLEGGHVMKYAKLGMQVLVTIAVAIVAAMAGDNLVDSIEWVNVAIVGVGAAAVFAGPNIPGAPVTKLVLSALAAILTILASAITDGIQTVEVIQMAIAAVGALGVWAVPNAGQTVSYDDTNVGNY
jgi:hypothetical protein